MMYVISFDLDSFSHGNAVADNSSLLLKLKFNTLYAYDDGLSVLQAYILFQLYPHVDAMMKHIR